VCGLDGTGSRAGTDEFFPQHRVGERILEKIMVAQLVRNSRLLWNPKVYYCVHRIMALGSILS
jgi:hypothetical protein